MNWKKWVASRAKGTPMSLSWLEQVSPIPVATYSATKLGQDEQPEGDIIRMTLSNVKLVQVDPETFEISWESGITVTLPPVAVDAGSISLQTADILAVRKLEVNLPGVDPQTREPSIKQGVIYSVSALEGTGLLIIEVIDMQEDLEGEAVEIEVVKA